MQESFDFKFSDCPEAGLAFAGIGKGTGWGSPVGHVLIFSSVARRYVEMAQNSGGDKFLYFLAGAGIGAVLALLFAPKSGKETRDLIARTATDGREYISQKVSEGRQFVGDTGRKVSDDFSSFVDRSKEALNRQKEQISAAFEAGKAAYREEKGHD
jgi:gas vesicle protein